VSEHDQRFKTLLREFFVHFLLLFFPRGPHGSTSPRSTGTTRS
jgi:hypothetical protein